MSDKENPYLPATPQEAYERLQLWYQDTKKLSSLKVNEHLERVLLTKYYFTSPVNGTNRLPLGGGYDLKLVHGYNYKVDVAAVDNVTPAQIKKHKLPWDELFVYKPELVMRVYNELSAEQKVFVDALLEIKPASPQLSIVEAKQEKQAAEETATADELILGVEDPEADDLKVGDYYEDGDGQWWIVESDSKSELHWVECDNPNPEQPKPKRGRKPKAS